MISGFNTKLGQLVKDMGLSWEVSQRSVEEFIPGYS